MRIKYTILSMLGFTAMNLFQFTLWQLVTIAVVGQKTNPMNHTRLPESFVLKFEAEGVLKTINLRRVKRVLANEFLPVWIAKDSLKTEFEKLNIMNKVGEFTMYHDDCTKSAFVYFRDRLELDGVIDVTYYVRGFPIDETKKRHFIESRYIHRVQSNGFLSRLGRSITNTVTIRSYCYGKLKVYPELLVAISHDTYTDIEEDSDLSPGIATISHVLTVYNAVDLLYKLVQSANIQLNIAGILIEGIPNLWNFVTKSYWGIFQKSYIDVDTIHPKISKYFWLRENHFPRHSYDFIVYHTRTPLKDNGTDEILGQTTPAPTGYMFPPDFHEDRLSSVVADFATYAHFTTVAHEIAHFFHAQHDGEGPFGHRFDVNSCGKSLMAASEHCSHSCLKWSSQTEAEFAEFFRMPVYCNLKNYPRSLAVPEPKLIFSGREQCECYGYKSKSKPAEHIAENECDRPLICIDPYDNEAEEVPLPMDGTPCGSKKVCWSKECVEY